MKRRRITLTPTQVRALDHLHALTTSRAYRLKVAAGAR